MKEHQKCCNKYRDQWNHCVKSGRGYFEGDISNRYYFVFSHTHTHKGPNILQSTLVCFILFTMWEKSKFLAISYKIMKQTCVSLFWNSIILCRLTSDLLEERHSIAICASCFAEDILIIFAWPCYNVGVWQTLALRNQESSLYMKYTLCKVLNLLLFSEHNQLFHTLSNLHKLERIRRNMTMSSKKNIFIQNVQAQ